MFTYKNKIVVRWFVLWSIIACKAFVKLEIYDKSTLVILSFFQNQRQCVSVFTHFVKVTLWGVKVVCEILKAIQVNGLYFIQK